jgi:hypothetical protein
MVEDTSTTAVVPALEANMAAFWAGYGRAPGAEIYEEEDLLRVLTGASEPLFNGVFRASLPPDAVDGAIAETLARVASRRVPMYWWVGPSTRPADLGTHLERRGFTHVGNSPAMAVELHAGSLNLLLPGLSIHASLYRTTLGRSDVRSKEESRDSSFSLGPLLLRHNPHTFLAPG